MSKDYDQYFNSTKPGEDVLSLIEWDQSFEGAKELAVYTLTDDRRRDSPYGEIKHFVVLAHTEQEAKRLIAFDSWPNNYAMANRLYSELRVQERKAVSAGVGLVDYFTETEGL